MIDGIIYSAQYLVLTRDYPLFAIELIKESGFSKKECIEAQKRTGYEDAKMIKVINEAFDKK